jgi:CII-binding regulator of phage lambda lysogenization HflD
MIMAAVQGNATAISQLASTVNCDINAVQAALNAIQGSICQLSNTVGLSGQ